MQSLELQCQSNNSCRQGSLPNGVKHKTLLDFPSELLENILYYMDTETFVNSISSCKVLCSIAKASRRLLVAHIKLIPGDVRYLNDFKTPRLYDRFRARAAFYLHGVHPKLTISEPSGPLRLNIPASSFNCSQMYPKPEVALVYHDFPIVHFHNLRKGLPLKHPDAECELAIPDIPNEYLEVIRSTFVWKSNTQWLIVLVRHRYLESYRLAFFKLETCKPRRRLLPTQLWEITGITHYNAVDISVSKHQKVAILWKQCPSSTLMLYCVPDGEEWKTECLIIQPFTATIPLGTDESKPHEIEEAYRVQMLSSGSIHLSSNWPFHEWCAGMPQNEIRLVRSWSDANDYRFTESVLWCDDLQLSGVGAFRQSALKLSIPFWLACKYISIPLRAYRVTMLLLILVNDKETEEITVYIGACSYMSSCWIDPAEMLRFNERDDYEAIASLERFPRTQSSLGIIYATSKKGTRIAVANWKTLYIWSLSPATLIYERELFYGPSFPELKPKIIECKTVIHNLCFSPDSNVLYGITDHGLVSWNLRPEV